MTWEALIAFNLVLAASIASPGPAFLMALKTSMTSGRAAGIATGLGLATMAATWTLAALLGLEAVFAVFPWAYTALKTVGALYLIWIAIQTWRSARTPLGEAPVLRRRAFIAGWLVNLGNPKSVLFAASVLVVIFPTDLPARDIGMIVANHFLLEVLFYTGFAVALTTQRAKASYLRAKPILDRIAATLLGLLGVRLLLEK